MKKLFLTLFLCFLVTFSIAGNILTESFEYGNHDLQTPVGWSCDDNSWLCGYLEKDHNCKPHTGNWYAFTTDDESWMFMPIYLIPEIHYRFSIWAVSDGSYNLSFCTGSAPSLEAMTVQFFSEDINANEYTKVSAYVEDIPEGCNYIGICAKKLQGDSYLSIDDVEIDMVQQFDFEAEAVTGDTTMYPGSQAIFHYHVHNTGYDTVDITLHPSNEYFTNFSSYVNGVSGATFTTQPDETVRVTTYATLRPEVQPGAMAWLDIMMTTSCNCNTAMVTFWVTPLDLTQTPENIDLNVSLFPNPATNHITIEVEGLQRVSIVDLQGRVTMTGNTSDLDISTLESGLYILSVETERGTIKRSFVKQ